MSHPNRGRISVRICDEWERYIGPIYGFEMLGLVMYRGTEGALVKGWDNRYYMALDGRIQTVLPTAKVEASMLKKDYPGG